MPLDDILSETYKELYAVNNTATPIYRIGSKGTLLKMILPLLEISRCHCFVDVFGGSGAVLLNRVPVNLEIYNDIDKNLVNFFRVLQNPELFPKLEYRLRYTPYSRLEFQKALAILNEHTLQNDTVALAWAYYVVSHQSYGANMRQWTSQRLYDKGAHPNGGHASRFARSMLSLKLFADRLRYVQIECDDAVNIIKRYDTPTTLLYCDPPYLHSTRVSKDLYEYEMTEEQHIELLDSLLSCQSAVVLSGYQSELYLEKLKDWNVYTKDCETLLSGVKSNARQEVVWRNERAIELCNDLSFF